MALPALHSSNEEEKLINENKKKRETAVLTWRLLNYALGTMTGKMRRFSIWGGQTCWLTGQIEVENLTGILDGCTYNAG